MPERWREDFSGSDRWGFRNRTWKNFASVLDPPQKNFRIKSSFYFILGEIPDAAFIHAARKRRQMARELGGEPPLVDTETPKKRLLREDQDASDDEEEEEKRIRFSGVKNKSQRQKIAEEIGTVIATVCQPAIHLYGLVLNQFVPKT